MRSEKAPRRRCYGLALSICLVASAYAQPDSGPAGHPATQPATQPATTQPASAPATQPEGPNIIFLFSGDQAAGMTGFEGNSAIQTPNLDRLAAEGAWFARCYTPTPQSAPARATVLTGQYPHTHGVTADGPGLNREANTFTARLKQIGYACGFVGEWDLPESRAREPGFGLTDYVATDDGRATGAETWINRQRGTTREYLTDWQADRAIDFLEKFKGRPFFLWVSFRAPHEPLEYPPKMASRYPPETLKLPATMNVDKKSWPNKFVSQPPPAAKRFEQKKADEKALLLDRSKYYAVISRLDENIGRILDRVDQLDLRKNTVVVFACCNGYALGDHALLGKGPAFYEELVRGPLVFRQPGLAEGGAKIERIVGLVDLAPTFLQLAGQRKPFTMQGQSLLPVLQDPRDPIHGDEEFFEYEHQPPEGRSRGEGYPCPVRGLVTRNYKYLDYMEPNGLFFDLKRDPEEMQNLTPRVAADRVYHRNYDPVVQVLKGRLNQWRKQTHDPTLTVK